MFKQTVSTFQNVYIFINNSGVLNDSIWRQRISINLMSINMNMDYFKETKIDYQLEIEVLLYQKTWTKTATSLGTVYFRMEQFMEFSWG